MIKELLELRDEILLNFPIMKKHKYMLTKLLMQFYKKRLIIKEDIEIQDNDKFIGLI